MQGKEFGARRSGDVDSGASSATSLLGGYASPFLSLGVSFPICKMEVGWTSWPGRALPSLAL